MPDHVDIFLSGEATMPGEALLTEMVIEGIATAFRYKIWRRYRLAPFLLARRSEEVRVAFSALVRIQVDGRYLLVHNLHRRDTYSPFGGVYKTIDGAETQLDRYEFRGEQWGPGDETRNDLRGFLPRKNILRMLRWFDAGEHRETAEHCISRELREELAEAGARMRVPNPLHLTLVQRVVEGPDKVHGEKYLQIRVFDVYDIVQTNQTRNFLNRIGRLGQQNGYLMLASPDEVRKGRAKDGRMIGHISCYLFSKKRLRPDEPPPYG